MMEWLPVAGAVLSLGLGLYGLLVPMGALRLVGLALDPARPEGISEVRATYGGVFTGISAAALVLGTPGAFAVLATGWAGAGIARTASVLADRAPLRPNLPGIVVEFGIAVLAATALL